jgi:hypothetical protein
VINIKIVLSKLKAKLTIASTLIGNIGYKVEILSQRHKMRIDNDKQKPSSQKTFMYFKSLYLSNKKSSETTSKRAIHQPTAFQSKTNKTLFQLFSEYSATTK